MQMTLHPKMKGVMPQRRPQIIGWKESEHRTASVFGEKRTTIQKVSSHFLNEQSLGLLVRAA